MKTPEDEAFDDLAKRQGDWGGGYQVKREAALDKLMQEQERLGLYDPPPQPAQKPVAWRWGNKKLNGGYEWRYTTYKTQPDAIPLYAAPPKTAQEQWNAALDEAANRIGEIAAFPKTTQDSFAVYIKGLKK